MLHACAAASSSSVSGLNTSRWVLQREPQARRSRTAAARSRPRTTCARRRTGSSSPRRRAAAARRRARAGTSPAARSATVGQQQHRRLRAGRLGDELVALAPPAADQQRGAHDQQQVAEDRADDRGLDDLLQALLEREQRDDQLRRVAERDVQQAADARARRGARAPRSRGPSAPRSARRRAPRRRRR